MTVSILVPCRNEKRHIREFLDSLLAQEIDPDWTLEVLVADGASDDGTRAILEEYSERCPQVRVIDNPERIVSTGLNAAIRASSGEIVIRMDAHTTYARDYVRECVRALRESGADNVGGPWVAVGRGTLGKAIAAASHLPICNGGGKSHDRDYEGAADTVYLGCWRRDVFDRIGMFDPTLVRNQDDEFNFRLLRSGGSIWQSPRIHSSYCPRASFRALFRQYLQYGYWKVAILRKYRRLASWRHAIPGAFVASIGAGLLTISVSALLGLGGLASVAAATLAAALGVYVAALVAASLPQWRTLGWRATAALPCVIATHHVAYGLGFLAGLFRRKSATSGMQSGDLFTALSR